jgi:8-oxo-dGTP pyrophosphatase MutT (NUDIX family)
MYRQPYTECEYHTDRNFDSVESKPDELLFLLVERKDTVGFLNLIQGAYSDAEPQKSRKLGRYVSELTCEERYKVANWSFDDLWKIAGTNKKNFAKSRDKFHNLNVTQLLANHRCEYQEADYLMPKGRLKTGETVRQCAIREFAEETGYGRTDVILLSAPPYIELFSGIDGKTYRNVFFLAQLRNNAYIRKELGDDPSQSKEVRNVGWFNLGECRKLIRNYHREKINILVKAHRFIEIYSSKMLQPIPSLGLQFSNFSPKRRDHVWSPERNRPMRKATPV